MPRHAGSLPKSGCIHLADIHQRHGARLFFQEVVNPAWITACWVICTLLLSRIGTGRNWRTSVADYMPDSFCAEALARDWHPSHATDRILIAPLQRRMITLYWTSMHGKKADLFDDDIVLTRWKAGWCVNRGRRIQKNRGCQIAG